MRKRRVLKERITAFFLAVIMILVSVPLELISAEEAIPNGIVITNNSYNISDPATEPNVYKITFYTSETTVVTDPDTGEIQTQTVYTEFPLSSAVELDTADTVIMNDGTLHITGKQSLALFDAQNPDGKFIKFLQDNNITRVTAQFYETATISEGSKKMFKLYSDTSSCTWDLTYQDNFHPETGLFEGRSVQTINGLATTDCQAVTFTSTELKDYDVNVDWYDKNRDNRPVSDLTFTFIATANDTPVTVDDTTPVKQSLNTNLDVYTYSLPAYTSDGTPIDYTLESNLPVTGYVSEINNNCVPVNNSFSVDYTRNTEFSVNVDFLDGAVAAANKSTVRPAINSQYIYDNFDFYVVGTNQDQLCTLQTTDPDAPYYVEIDGSSVKVKNIPEMDKSGGKPFVYYLKKKDSFDDRTANKVQNSVSPYVGENDYYSLVPSNVGVNSSELSKIYADATLTYTLTGETEFKTTIDWHDDAKEDERKAHITNGDSVGSAVLWRYVDKNQADDKNKTAQVGSCAFNNQTLSGDDYESFTFKSEGNTTLPKFDLEGNPYVYYAKGSINHSYNDGSNYTNTVSDSERISGISGSIANGATITAKLYGVVVQSVSAEWVAGSRQGGTATVTYKLQKKDSSGNWVDVTGNNNQTVELSLGTFTAEQMKIRGSFPDQPMYNDEGQKQEYRIVQTHVERTDNGTTNQYNNPQSIVIVDDPEDSTKKLVKFIDSSGNEHDSFTMPFGSGADADSYVVTGVVGDNGEVQLTYTLVMTKPIKLTKTWQPSPNGGSKAVTLSLLYFDYNSKSYKPYSELIESMHNADPTFNPAFTGSVTFSDNKYNGNTAYEIVDVLKYDSEGREYMYRIAEVGSSTATSDGKKYSPQYKLENGGITTAGEAYNADYIAENILGGDLIEIKFQKVWMDDGEKEYRNGVSLYANSKKVTAYNSEGDPAFGSRYPNSIFTSMNSSSYDYKSTGAVMNEQDFYETEVIIQRNENGNENADVEYTTYDKSDFIESIPLSGSDQSYGYYLPGYEFAAGTTLDYTNWLQLIKSDNYASNLTSTNYTDVIETTKGWVSSFFDQNNFNGVYKNRGHYYAVEYQPEYNGNNATIPNNVNIINTRIGVVSYKINFDWKIGDSLSDIKSVTLRITGTSSNFNQSTDVTISDLSSLGNSPYYILNLPKYDRNGKVIEYSVQQISMKDKNDTAYTVTNTGKSGTCTFGSEQDKCDINVSEQVYHKSTEAADSNSDDLIELTITNTFKDKIKNEVYKKWLDNNNAYNTRGDIYIRLERYKTKLYGNVSKNIKDGYFSNDYVWTKDYNNDSKNWEYKFTGLAKYDAEGYKYTYYVTELETVRGYYAPYYVNDINASTSNPSNSNYVTIYNSANDQSSTNVNAATNGQFIVNRLNGTVTVSGDKVWKDILSGFADRYYPVATVKLYATRTYDDNGDALEEGNKIERVATTTIYNGDKSYSFNNPDDNTHNFPKYDGGGALITYTPVEEPIGGVGNNAYEQTLTGSTLTNTYTGGDPVTFTVNKNWKNIPPQFNDLPTVYVTIHQAVYISPAERKRIDNVTTNKALLVDYRTWTKQITSGTWSCTFGVAENLRKLSPRGDAFVYYITETMTNYLGTTTPDIYPDGDLKYGDVTLQKGTFEFEGKSNVSSSYLGYNVTTATTYDNNTDHQITTLTNDYKPDLSNFKAEVDVTKNWNFGSYEYQKSNYDLSYSFKLNRHSKQNGINETLFQINIPDKDAQDLTPTISIIGTKTGGNGSNLTLTPEEGYYELDPTDNTKTIPKFVKQGDTDNYKCCINIKKDSYNAAENVYEPVVITVNMDKTSADYGKVICENLAIYAEDATPFYYKAEEVNLTTPFEKIDDKKEEQQINVSTNTASLKLNNKLKMKEITIEQLFGAQTGTDTIERLRSSEYDMFFSSGYINKFRYLIQSSDNEISKTINGNELTLSTPMPMAANINTQSPYYKEATEHNTYLSYSKSGIALPQYAPNGTPYVYYIYEDIPDYSGTVDSQHKVDIYATTDPTQYKHPDANPYQNTNHDFNSTKDAANFDVHPESGYKGIVIPTDKNSVYFSDVFPAKIIDIKKIWDDNNNADGVRPDALKFILTEKQGNTTVATINEFVSDYESWTKENVHIPKFFYYTESGAQTINEIDLTEDDKYYSDSANNPYSPNFVEVSGETLTKYDYSRVSSATIDGQSYTANAMVRADDDALSVNYLQLINSRNRYSGELSITKNFAQTYDNNWKVRENTYYFKVIRMIKTIGNDQSVSYTNDTSTQVTDTDAAVIKDYDGKAFDETNNNIAVSTTPTGSEVSVNSATGLITITTGDTTKATFPTITLKNLPYANNTNGSVSSNGAISLYAYKVVECDKNGYEIKNDESDPTTKSFPYTWSSKFGNSTDETNETAETKTFEQTVDSNNKSVLEKLENTVTNTLKTVKYKVIKEWDDNNDYYKTRDNYTLKLQYSIDGTNYSDVSTLYTGYQEKTVDITQTKQKNGTNGTNDPVNNYETVFVDLPKYIPVTNSGITEYKKVTYNAVETMIGRSIVTVNNNNVLGTYNYKVTYTTQTPTTDESAAGFTGKIKVTNELKTAPDLTQIKAVKKWSDNKNQDGKRTPVNFKLRQYTLDQSGQDIESNRHYTNNFTVTVDVTKTGDKWEYKWEKLPMYASETEQYYYYVEETVPTGYTLQNPITGTTNQVEPTDIKDSVDTSKTIGKLYTFENKYTPDKKKLTLTKTWNDNSNYYNTRPDQVKYVLYCEYDTYTRSVSGDGTITYTKDANGYKGTVSASAVKGYLDANYETEQTKTSATDITGNRSTIEFSDLPVRINPLGTDGISAEDGVSVAVKYYIKEEFYNGDNKIDNVKNYTTDTTTQFTTDGTTLLNGGSASDKALALTNSLVTRDVTVQVVWNDNGYKNGESGNPDLHYDLAISLSNEIVGYNDTIAITAADTLTKSVKFTGVPTYDKSNSTVIYTVKEAPRTTEPFGTTVDTPTLTNTTSNVIFDTSSGKKYEYVGSVVGYKSSADSDVLTHAIITNLLPVTKFEVNKTWDDNGNQDGYRPETLNYTITRGESGNGAFSITDSSTNSGHWANATFDSNYYPYYQADNNPYNYAAAESAANGDGDLTKYDSGSPAIQKTGTAPASDSYQTTTSFALTNTRTATDTRDITVTKNWVGDTAFESFTRPTEVKIQLYRKYGNGTPVPVEGELQTLNETNHWTYTYNNLDVNKNVGGTETANGTSHKYTYYVEEVGAESGNLIGYTTTYSSQNHTDVSDYRDAPVGDNNEITIKNTLKTGKVKIGKNWEDKGSKENLHYDVTANIVIQNGDHSNTVIKSSVSIPDSAGESSEIVLPVYLLNNSGNSAMLAEYEAVETSGNKYSYTNLNTGTFTVYTDDTTVEKYDITNTLGVKQFTATKVWEDDSNRDGLRPASVSLRLQRRVNNGAWQTVDTKPANAENSWYVNFGFYSLKNELTADYEYRIVELDGTTVVNENGTCFDNEYTLTSIVPSYHKTQEATEVTAANYGEANRVHYTFTNTHSIYQGNLTVNKSWVGDEDYYTWTRPTADNSVTVKIYCKYGPENNKTTELLSGNDNLMAAVKTLNNNDSISTNNVDIRSAATIKLPQKINVGGTSYFVSYYVVENKSDKLNGYEVSGYNNTVANYTSPEDAAVVFAKAVTAKTITVSNKLIMRDLTIQKAWQKHGNSIDSYAVDAKVELQNGGDVSYSKSPITIPADSTTGTTISLPLYIKTGVKAQYSITETTPDKYKYIVSYSDSNFTLNDTDIAKTVTITNTLPVINLTFTKIWKDKYDGVDNKWGLRPDDITLTLQQARDEGGTYSWTNFTAPTSTVDKTTNSDQWVYTYSNLPQFDSDNTPFVYRIVEDDIPAYTCNKSDRTTVATAPVTTTPVQETEERSLGLTNTLITHDVALVKKWVDNGYDGEEKTKLHYDITATINSTGLTPQITFSTDITSTQNDSTTNTSQPLVCDAETISSVPTFDRDGKEIVYTVAEQPKTNSSIIPYGYVYTAPESYASTADTDGKVTKTYTLTNTLPLTKLTVEKDWVYSQYNAENQSITDDTKKVKKVTLTGKSNNTTIDTFTCEDYITKTTNKVFDKLLIYDDSHNQISYTVVELPEQGYITTYSDNTHAYSSNTFAVSAAEPATATPVFTDSGTVTITNTEKLGTASVQKIDKTFYDEYHTKYSSTYKSKVVPGAEFELYIKVNGADTPVAVTGTPGSYTVFKNITTVTQDKDDSNKKVTANTAYKLYQNETPVKLKKNKEGLYVISNLAIATDTVISDETQDRIGFLDLPNGNYKLKETGETPQEISFTVTSPTTTNKVISGSDGMITISGLPINTYYLKEITAPTGYQLNATPENNIYTFAVTAPSVTANSQATVSYTDSKFIDDNPVKSIGNEEILNNSVTLTKQDHVTYQAIKTSKATYYLLRMIPYSIKKTGENSEYAYKNAADAVLSKAVTLETVTYSDEIAAYWDKVGEYQTDSNGQIIITSGLMHGRYAFLEVQAPIGYKRSFDSSSVVFEVDTTNYSQQLSKDHEDPRKSAKVQIFKGDNFGNGLNGAIFELYKVRGNDPDLSNDECIATVKTDYDGLNDIVVNHKVNDLANFPTSSDTNLLNDDNSIILNDWATYYFREVYAPPGYETDSETDNNDSTMIRTFIVDASIADMTMYIDKAKDARIKGKVILTKTTEEELGTVPIGTVQEGAKFKLYSTSDTANPLTVYQSTENDKTNYYSASQMNGYNNSPVINNELTTHSDGTIHLEGLSWGSYYLMETEAPSGYTNIDSSTGDANKVYFSVGRNNCGNVEQQLTCTDEIAPAYLTIKKTIDKKLNSNWGDPTFTFKIKQTNDAAGNLLTNSKQRVVSLTFSSGDGISKQTEEMKIEPGTYTITELNVSRYAPGGSCTLTTPDQSKITSYTLGSDSATFTVSAGGHVRLGFDNKLDYYDKFSHVDTKVNNFGKKNTNGYKGIKAEPYKIPSVEPNGTLVINKSVLTVKLINADGSLSNDVSDNCTYTYTDNNKRFYDDPTFKVNDNGTKISIPNAAHYVDSVYNLTVSYTTTGGETLTTTVDLVFPLNDESPKTIKTVEFVADDSNMSYFNENDTTTPNDYKSGGTGKYAYEFTVVSDGNTPIVYVKHNDKIILRNIPVDDLSEANIQRLLTDAGNSFTVNSAFIDTKERYAWNDGSTDYTDSATNLTALKNAIIAFINGSSEEYTLTAKLRNKTNP